MWIHGIMSYVLRKTNFRTIVHSIAMKEYGAAAYELCEILCAHAFMITPMSSFDFAKFISTANKTCLVYEFYSHID